MFGASAGTRVEIDLNDADAKGVSMVFLRDADGPLHAGQMVTAFESEDAVAAPALVQRVDEANGVAYIWVNWSEMSKEVSASPKLFSDMSTRALAAVANAQIRARVTATTQKAARIRARA